MFDVKCIIKPSILNVALPMDVIRKALILVKYEYMFLLYNHNTFWIMNFNVKVLLILTPLIENLKIGELGGFFIYT